MKDVCYGINATAVCIIEFADDSGDGLYAFGPLVQRFRDYGLNLVTLPKPLLNVRGLQSPYLDKNLIKLHSEFNVQIIILNLSCQGKNSISEARVIFDFFTKRHSKVL